MTHSFQPSTDSSRHPAMSPTDSVAPPQQTPHDPADESYQLARTVAEAADDRKGGDIVLLNVSDISYIADYFVIITGYSNVQVRAIARMIEDNVEDKWQRYPLRIEGQSEGIWVLIDYGEVVAHIFMPEEREFYGLEAFWGHAETIPFVADAASP
jgi:ribosome-associated protein